MTAGVRTIAFLPSSMCCPAAPRRLQEATTRLAGRLSLVTMKPTRGTNSPGCRSTLATTRRFLSHDPARWLKPAWVRII